MKTRNEGPDGRERFTDGEGNEPTRRTWLKTGAVIAVVLIGVTAAGLMLANRGSHDESSTSSSASGATAQPSADPSAQANAAVAASATAPAAAPGATSAPVVREGLPPDLTVSVEDTLVTPGQAVEFVVNGTSDVAEVALSDGRDDPMPLVRDQGKDTWRATYRVPLHPRHERFGVSVTAKNEANRWRRAWVFLHVASGDSTRVASPVDNPDEMPDHH